MTQMMMKRRRMWRLPTVQKVSRKRKKLDPDDFLLEGKRVAEPGFQTAGLLQTMPCCVSTCLITSFTFCSGVSPPSVHILCVSKIYFIGVGGVGGYLSRTSEHFLCFCVSPFQTSDQVFIRQKTAVAKRKKVPEAGVIRRWRRGWRRRRRRRRGGRRWRRHPKKTNKKKGGYKSEKVTCEHRMFVVVSA